MADESVPLSFFVTTTKALLTLIHDLTIEMQVQRVALLNVKAEDLPLKPDYLKGLAANIRQVPELGRTREAILSMSTTEEIDEVLRRLEGL